MAHERLVPILRGGSLMLLAVLLATAVGGAARASVVISDKPTQNMNCSGGVCTATAAKAVLNAGDLAAMLATGDVAVKTGSSAKDIEIASALSWASTSRLTLDARYSVTLDKPVTVTGTGALTIATNDGGKHGEFIIVPEHGSVQFWDLSSSLVIDGNSYTLVGDIATLAADVANNPSGFYALAKPYDASGDGTYSSAPVGTIFAGAFDGLGNTISNLIIRFPANGNGLTALFGRIGSVGRVRDIGVLNADLENTSAGIIGEVAALAARNDGVVDHCWATASIVVSGGGVAGPGGLISENQGTIDESYAIVKIRMKSGLSTVGGLVGANYGRIFRSYVGGSVSGDKGDTTEDIGGLLGYNNGVVENTFAVNFVHRASHCCEALGGLIGKNDSSGRVTSSYAAGEIKLARSGSGYLGGLIGADLSNENALSNTYWDLDLGVSDPTQGAGNIENDPGIAGLTSAQLRSGLRAGFDPKIWGQNAKINHGYPYLLALPPK